MATAIVDVDHDASRGKIIVHPEETFVTLHKEELTMTDTTRPRKIVVAGACVMGNCDCRVRDGLQADASRIPPFHDGCTCYMVEIEETDTTQPKPDGTRNRPEAYAFGICWAALEWLEAQAKT